MTKPWLLSAALLCLACSASPSINVGNEADGSVAGSGGASGFGGVGGIAGGDDTLTASVTEPPSEVAIDVITISCAGECKHVLAIASGGNEPYTFRWSDGVATAAREICADADTTFSVTVTDTAFQRPDLDYEAQQVSASVRAQVLTCPSDGGTEGGVATTILVPGLADLWLVGQPDGARLTNIEGGSDVAPINSPIELVVSEGTTLRFTVTGAVSNSALPCGGTPDGGCSLGLPTAIAPTQGLAGLTAPLNSLIGVFLLDASAPLGPAPASLDATTTSSLTSLSPLLAQPFFIGDGLTGTGSGVTQQFTVPSGATRLFLASLDAVAGNYNNTGSFTVEMSVAP